MNRKPVLYYGLSLGLNIHKDLDKGLNQNFITQNFLEGSKMIFNKVFIFDNRIEIISPGKLPNTLTVDYIKMGTSMPRNSILFTNARYLLPFVGVVSGIPRAIKNSPDLELINDLDREVFVAVIKRPVSAFWRNVCYI